MKLLIISLTITLFSFPLHAKECADFTGEYFQNWHGNMEYLKTKQTACDSLDQFYDFGSGVVISMPLIFDGKPHQHPEEKIILTSKISGDTITVHYDDSGVLNRSTLTKLPNGDLHEMLYALDENGNVIDQEGPNLFKKQ